MAWRSPDDSTQHLYQIIKELRIIIKQLDVSGSNKQYYSDDLPNSTCSEYTDLRNTIHNNQIRIQKLREELDVARIRLEQVRLEMFWLQVKYTRRRWEMV